MTKKQIRIAFGFGLIALMLLLALLMLARSNVQIDAAKMLLSLVIIPFGIVTGVFIIRDAILD